MSQRYVIPIRTFRWGNVLFTAILGAVALLSLAYGQWLGVLAFGGMAAAMVVHMTRGGRLVVDAIGITHVAGARTYHIRWDELVAVELVDLQIFLLLGEGKRFTIPFGLECGPETERAVRRFIEAQVAARALPRQHSNPRRGMHYNVKVDPASIAWARVDAPPPGPQPAAPRPAHSPVQAATEADAGRTPIDGSIVIPPVGAWVMWSLFGLPAAMSAIALLSGAPVAALIILLLLGAPALLGALRIGAYEVTEYWVAHRCPLGTYRIFWDEVTLVELGENWRVALRGGDKRFVMPSFHWSHARANPDAQRMVREKVASLPARHVHQPSLWIGWHRNVRE